MGRVGGAHELPVHRYRWTTLGEGFGLTAQTEDGVGAERVCGYMERALEGW